MYCPNCGKALEKEAQKFCPECGAEQNVTEIVKGAEAAETEIAEEPKAKAEAPSERPLAMSCKWTVALLIATGVMLVVQIILSACSMGCVHAGMGIEEEIIESFFACAVGFLYTTIVSKTIQIPAIIALVNGIRFRQRKWRKIAIIGLVGCVVLAFVSSMIYYGFAMGAIFKSRL